MIELRPPVPADLEVVPSNVVGHGYHIPSVAISLRIHLSRKRLELAQNKVFLSIEGDSHCSLEPQERRTSEIRSQHHETSPDRHLLLR